MASAALLNNNRDDTKQDRSVPGYTSFSIWNDWRTCIIYHLIYHYTVKLHLNHLLLLHTYLLGIYIFACGCAGIYILSVVTCLFCCFDILFARFTVHGWSHSIFVHLPLSIGSYYLTTSFLQTSLELSTLNIIIASLSLMLCSLLLQVAGHSAWEEFQAPAAITHGLLAAPVLEWTTMWLRLYPDVTLWTEVEASRERARRK